MKLTSIIATVLVAVSSMSALAPVAEARDRTIIVEDVVPVQHARGDRRDRDDRGDYRRDRRGDRSERRDDRRQDRRYDRNDRRRDAAPPWANRDRRKESGNWKFQYD